MLFKIDINEESRPSYDTIFQYLFKLNVFRIMITIKFNFNIFKMNINRIQIISKKKKALSDLLSDLTQEN